MASSRTCVGHHVDMYWTLIGRLPIPANSNLKCSNMYIMHLHNESILGAFTVANSFNMNEKLAPKEVKVGPNWFQKPCLERPDAHRSH